MEMPLKLKLFFVVLAGVLVFGLSYAIKKNERESRYISQSEGYERGYADGMRDSKQSPSIRDAWMVGAATGMRSATAMMNGGTDNPSEWCLKQWPLDSLMIFGQ